MMDNGIGRMILLLILVFLGILAFVYLGIPILKGIIVIMIKLVWWVASLLSGFVRIVIFLVLLIAIVIGLVTFVRWLMDEKQIQ